MRGLKPDGKRRLLCGAVAAAIAGMLSVSAIAKDMGEIGEEYSGQTVLEELEFPEGTESPVLEDGNDILDQNEAKDTLWSDSAEEEDEELLEETTSVTENDSISSTDAASGTDNKDMDNKEEDSSGAEPGETEEEAGDSGLNAEAEGAESKEDSETENELEESAQKADDSDTEPDSMDTEPDSIDTESENSGIESENSGTGNEIENLESEENTGTDALESENQTENQNAELLNAENLETDSADLYEEESEPCSQEYSEEPELELEENTEALVDNENTGYASPAVFLGEIVSQGSDKDLELSLLEEAMMEASLPENLSPQRKEIVRSAYSLVGKVNYFWGGKSTELGWDERWGNQAIVGSTGSKTTGTERAYGLDCSGYVLWCMINAFENTDITASVGSGTASQWNHSKSVSPKDALPGDLVFYSKPNSSSRNHVGIVVGREWNGELLVAHCSAGANDVVVSRMGDTGFQYIRQSDILLEGEKEGAEG